MSSLLTNLSSSTTLSPDEQAQADWDKDLEPLIDNSGGFSDTASIPNIITLLHNAKIVSTPPTTKISYQRK